MASCKSWKNNTVLFIHWRGKVLCVYSKHNNGKARSREEHAVSPSLWKEYYLKTRQTIQVAASALHWNICIMFELHGKFQKLEK
jgi:hypothetical protein